MSNRFRQLTILRGALSMILGLLLLFWPMSSAEAIIMVIGAFALLIGLVSVFNAFSMRFTLWQLSAAGGVITALLGLVALGWPAVVTTIIVWLIAIWALIFGVLEIIAGWIAGLNAPLAAVTIGVGLLSIVLAILLFAMPELGVVAMAWIIGFYFVATGALTIWHAVESGRPQQRVAVQ